jgi:hypothetical protein
LSRFYELERSPQARAERPVATRIATLDRLRCRNRRWTNVDQPRVYILKARTLARQNLNEV